TDKCFVNKTTNIMWINIPHFSGSDATVKGTSVPGATYSHTSETSTKVLGTSIEVACVDRSITLNIDKTDSVVRVVSTDYLQSYEMTLEGGKFRKTGLDNGEYYVIATRSGYKQYKEKVTVNCDETTVAEVLPEPVVIEIEETPPTELGEQEQTVVEDKAIAMENTKTAIDNANAAIKKAESEKRTVGIEIAKQKIEAAASAFNAKNYEYGKTLAEEATILANNALAPATKPVETPTPKIANAPAKSEPMAQGMGGILLMLGVGAVLLVVLVGAYFVMKSKKK
ncbi:MAG: hypothetical protein ABII22_01205, partial [Candidatus Micrarchaeota archaeon]